ncbi:MAG: TolB family protein, partial [Woeseiaceae bacterium]
MAAESSSRLCGFLLLLIAAIATARAELLIRQGTNLAADVSTVDARLAIDLLGSIWVVPAGGGQARLLSDNLLPAKRPRWSPDAGEILYQTQDAGMSQIWIVDADGTESSRISDGHYFDQHPDWHPDGERIVFSSARGTSGFDIWEADLPTGLRWRLTSNPGDEMEPVWSADGRDLAYLRRHDSHWSLVLRRHGQAEQEVVVSSEPLYAPSWRPDGSLLTYLRQSGRDLSIEMAILSDPPLVRAFVSGEDFFLSPVSWLDRKRLFYTADGTIKTRDFDDWRSTSIAFHAAVGEPDSRSSRAVTNNELPLINPPSMKLVIR